MFEFKPEDGISEDVLPILNSEAVQGILKKQFETHFELQASGLKKTNAEIKAEKQKLKELLDAKAAIDPDEYKALKESSKNKGKEAEQLERLHAELEAIKSGRDAEIGAAKTEAEKYRAALEAEQLKMYVAGAIADYNSKATLKVVAGAEKYLINAAMQAFTRDEKGGFVPMDGERVLTGKDGIMSGAEWVNAMRDKEPLFYEKPTGSGATGSKGAGGAYFNPAQLSGSPEERKKAIAARFNLA